MSRIAHTQPALRCRQLRTKLSRSQAWQSWWSEARPSTFNAIVARDCPANEDDFVGGSSHSTPPRTARLPKLPRLRNKRTIFSW